MSTGDIQHMREACDLAAKNVLEYGGGPFGCVIVRDNRVIARGANCVVREEDPTSHAEIVALRLACKAIHSIDLSDCVVYSSCEPCSMCFSALRWARIGAIYFSNTRADAASIGFRDDDIYNQIIEKKQRMNFLPVPEAGNAFRLWAEAEEKAEY